MPLIHIDNLIQNGIGEEVVEKLFKEIKSINLKLNKIMTKQEKFDQILTRLDEVTTNIAGDFSTFLEEYKAGTVSDESIAKAEANIAKLEELAASKENPVPDVPTENPTDDSTSDAPVDETPTEDNTTEETV